MYAIIENGGKQYKAVEGEYIDIDLLQDEVGKKKTFDQVLLLSKDGKTDVGEPYLKGVSVDATITSHFKAPKVIIFKYRAKQRFRVKTGHRQKYSRVLVDSIAFPGKSAAVKKSEDAAPVEKPAAEKKTAAKPKTGVKKAAPAKAVKSTAAAKKTTASKAKSTATKKSAAPSAKKPAASKAKTTAKKPAASKAKTTAKEPAAAKAAVDKKKPSADKK